MNRLKEIIYKSFIPNVGVLFIRTTTIPVIYYHNIVSDGNGFSLTHLDASLFKQQINFLKENDYKTYKFNEIPAGLNKYPQKKEIIITFDDGFLSNYTIVYPLMKAMGLKFNIFLAAQKMEMNSINYLTWNMVKEMNESGIVGFGAHTYTHIDSRKINDDNYDNEIVLTNQLIKKYTGEEITDFCFPYGHYNNDIINMLREKKVYKRLYSSDYMKLKQLADLEIVGRISISNDYDLNAFRKHIEGYYNVMYHYMRFRKFLKG